MRFLSRINKFDMDTNDLPYTIRPGTHADSYAVFEVFYRSLADLDFRQGRNQSVEPDPTEQTQSWETFQSLFEHLAESAEHYWLAEDESQVIGYARSINRHGVRELTDFFVLPYKQSAGVGRDLLSRAFPKTGAKHRTIIATTDVRAQARYLKTGVYPRFPIYTFWRTPEYVDVDTDLTFEPITESIKNLEVIGMLDEAILGHRRDADHAWLLNDRKGYLYLRDGSAVGYGYIGQMNGPFALLEQADIPAALGHAECEAFENGHESFGIDVPMINNTAVDYLLDRDYCMGSFAMYLMSDTPVGKYENYILTSPPFFI
jgi:hypothetical protein